MKTWREQDELGEEVDNLWTCGGRRWSEGL